MDVETCWAPETLNICWFFGFFNAEKAKVTCLLSEMQVWSSWNAAKGTLDTTCIHKRWSFLIIKEENLWVLNDFLLTISGSFTSGSARFSLFIYFSSRGFKNKHGQMIPKYEKMDSWFPKYWNMLAIRFYLKMQFGCHPHWRALSWI